MRIIIKWSDGTTTNTNLLKPSAKNDVIAELRARRGAEIVETLETEENIEFTNRKFVDAYDIIDRKVDICPHKAKNVVLKNIRTERETEFKKLGVPFKLAPELETAVLSSETRQKLQKLRDATNPLKTNNIIPLETLDKININNITEILGA